jgi:hypothetical protein
MEAGANLVSNRILRLPVGGVLTLSLDAIQARVFRALQNILSKK